MTTQDERVRDGTCATCRHNFSEYAETAACGLSAEKGQWCTRYPHETCDDYEDRSCDE